MATARGDIKQGARNLYRQRWAVQVGQEVSVNDKGVLVDPSPINIIQRFNGGMVYTSDGEPYVLIEQVMSSRPFLLVFGLTPRPMTEIQQPDFLGLPDEVARGVRKACEKAVAGIKLAKNLHNVEVDATRFIGDQVSLPDGWSLAKAVMKVDIRTVPGVACDCDVDGPCGYCCDTCDCNSCYCYAIV
jgi:hypothetical protein